MNSLSDEESARKDDNSLMVKLQGRDINGCYICGASNPNWHVFSKPTNNSVKNPFFPFLEYHEAPTNARPMERGKGKVDVCAVCYSFLTQQWRAFEEKDTPVVKRIYWLKRPDHESFEGFDKEQDRPCDSQQAKPLDNEVFERHQHSKPNCSSDHEHKHCGHDPSHEPSQHHYPNDTTKNERFNANEDVEQTVSSDNKKESSLEFCFVCSRQKPKEFMRSVHTRPQLKTETPFYPCLAKHSPAVFTKKMDYLGKVLVCEACQKFLFRQWQVFQKNNTPLGERQYQLRSDPSLPRERQSQLSTMVCFICGVTQPATSGRFLYSYKHSPGDPYYPFLNKLQPPPGAMPLTKQGLTRACSGCRKSLHRQWKEFEAKGLPEDEREYRIRNDDLVASGRIATSSSTAHLMSLIQPIISQGSLEAKLAQSRLTCYTCGESCNESNMRPIYTRQNTNPLKDSVYFPCIALREPPLGSRPLDNIGRTLVCNKCYKSLQFKWEHYEREMVPQQRRIYTMDGKSSIKLKSQSHICYLCGIKCTNTAMNFKLHSYPHNGDGVQDGGSFFPFLASWEPKENALPISPEGTVIACEICFNNLMVQWRDFENSTIPEESNRWLRKYRVEHIVCYCCGHRVPRPDCCSISRSLVAPKFSAHVPPQSIVTNKGQFAIVCGKCYRRAANDKVPTSKELKSHPTIAAYATEEERCAFNESKRTHHSNHISHVNKSVIVIDSSDSDDDGRSIAKHKNRHPRSGRHANTPPMHYTASVSPGVNSQSSAPTKDYPLSGSPSSNMQPSTSRSFAAALRKLAKQAMPPGTSSPATSSPSGSQPASPTVSHASSRSTGVSPSRNSPATTQTPPPPPPPPRGDGANSKERPPSHNAERELTSIITPSMPPIPALESDSPNTSEPNRVPSRGPHRLGSRDQPELAGQSKGHEVLPGVYSTRPRYQAEPGMLSEHYTSEHGHPVVPYYLHGGRPDVPLFLPRTGPLPGPPPLLGSKRDGGDQHVSPFFQGGFPPSDVPLPSISVRTDHQSPQSISSDKEKPKEVGTTADSHEHGPMGHRMYYYNDNKPPSSCPVHGHSPGEPHHKHTPGRPEQIPVSKPDRPEEFNRIFLPPHPDGAAMIHPYLLHTSREGPFGPHHLGERQAELFRERERQEMMMHQRMMIDQREQLKAREEEWQRRQQRLRQEKEGHQRDVVQYRHQILQQQREMEQPRRGEQDSRRTDQRQVDPRERSDKSPHTNERPKSDLPHENEMYRHYPFHPAFHPIPHDIRGRHPFTDFPRKEGEVPRTAMEAIKDGRTPHRHTYGFHDAHYPPFSDPYPFHRDGRVPTSSVSDRILADSRWSAHTRPTYMNGDMRAVEMHQPDMSNKLSEELSSKLKKEGDAKQQPVRIKQYHDKAKLRFLEGLGLVTLEKKKELTHGDPSVKRKFEESPNPVSQEDKASTDSTGQRDETEETSSEGTTDAESATTSTDTETATKQYTEKIKFMSRLGLVPPQTRHEMEQTYEVMRSERKKRKKKGRGRPSKRSKKEQVNNDTENGRTSIDAENLLLGGPMTRQKQQQLIEQGLMKHTEQKIIMEENGEHNKDLPVKIKIEAKEDSTSPYMFSQENRFKNQGQHSSSLVDQQSSRPPPRLTLQSLTNMEDPFNSYNTPTFRPPYLRHTGLLSVSQDTTHPALGQPLRPEPVHSTGLSLSEQETRDYLARRGSPSVHPDFSRHFGLVPSQQGSSFEKMVPVHSRPGVDVEKKDPGSWPPPTGRKDREYRWPGVESVMKAYFLHSGERDHEMNFLQDNADMLKSQHASLNEEASSLNTQMTNLVQTKKHLHDEKKACRENLDRLHYFMQSFQR